MHIGNIYVIILWKWFEMTNSEFDSKVAIWREYIYKSILFKVRFNGNLADDLTQQTFIKAYNYLKSNRINSGAYKSWLYSIAMRVIIDDFRKNNNIDIVDCKSFHDNEDLHDEYFLEEDFSNKLVDNIISKDIIYSSLEELKKQNNLSYDILLDVVDNLEYSEIAQKNNMPINTVKTKVFRARKFLNDYLKKKNLSVV